MTEGITAAYRTWEEPGFEALRDRFAALDDLAGRDVALQLGAEAVAGRASGVDDAGRLIVELPDGERATARCRRSRPSRG